MSTVVAIRYLLPHEYPEKVYDICVENEHRYSLANGQVVHNSGKDFVLDKALSGHGFTEINSDKALEYLMDREGLDKKMPESEKERRDFIRSKAKNTTELQQRLALYGRNGVIINGTGDTVEKIQKIKDLLEKTGYDSMMLSVNVSDEISRQRNIERGERGGRTVPEKLRKEKYESIQKSKPIFKEMFGQQFIEFDNSEDLRTAPHDVVVQKEKELMGIFNKVRNFVNTPHKSKIARNWIADELQKKDVSKISSIKPEIPEMANRAKELGLEYYGFGRYGKQHKVTHRVVNGQLIPVEHQMTESYSDSATLNLLLLGNHIDEPEFVIGEQKDINLLRDKRGKIKTFKLRRTAAREAHQKGGEVVAYKNYYMVKINPIKEDIDMLFESIDFGIEKGNAVNSYAKEKLDKNGKVTVIEDEPKKVGISLSTFRSKNVI